MNKKRQNTFNAKEALQEIEIFKCLDDEAIGQVSNLVKWKQYRKAVEVIAYKDESDDVYFLASGQVSITIFSFAGKEISYQGLGPGAMFGELSAIDQLPRTANVITLEIARIGAMSRNDYWRLIDRYPSVAAASLKRLASLVRLLTDRVYQYGALDVKGRVRMEVLRLARESMSGDDTATIQHFPTHSEIANRVNTHREAVTRELNELSRMGLIEQNQRVLTVTAVSHLEDLLPEDI
jgi:CRP-like cAMP-binding protein